MGDDRSERGRTRPGTRCMAYLCEDDRVGHRGAAEVLVEEARAAGVLAATIWRGIEGFGATGRLRAARLPDLARGLPLIVEVVGDDETVAAFLPRLHDAVPGALVTTEPVQLAEAARSSA